MAAGSAGSADHDRDPLLAPLWEDTPDETEADRPRAHAVAAASSADPLAGPALPALLGPLCDATDALARLDASAAAVPAAVRDGLIARMAFAKAAGWLAHAQSWVHPLDLALRDLGLTGSYALAVSGNAGRVLPQTTAKTGRSFWEEQTVDELADADRSVAEALALARLLSRLAGTGRDLFATAAKAEQTLAPFGTRTLDPGRFARWRADHGQRPGPTAERGRSGRGGKGESHGLPPLLAAGLAAQAWMESGITDQPTPLVALLAAVALLARSGPRSIFVPVWTAYPACCFGDRDDLPRLRTEIAARVTGRGRPAPWPVAFLHMIAESARVGLRQLDKLMTAAGQGRDLAARHDRRSRLPDALEALLRAPVLTPKALAARLRIAPQTATSLLRDLQAAGLVREVTGRESFRAFAV
jgi:hypothetical protein